MSSKCSKAAWFVTAACAVAIFVLGPGSVWSQFKPFKPFKPATKPNSNPGINAQVDSASVHKPKPMPFVPQQTPKPNNTLNNVVDFLNKVPTQPFVPNQQPKPFIPFQPSNVVPNNNVAPNSNVVPNNVVPNNPTVKVNEVDVPVDVKKNAVGAPHFGLPEQEQQKLLDDVKTMETNQAQGVEESLGKTVFNDGTRQSLVDHIAMTDPVKANAVNSTLQGMPINIQTLQTQMAGQPNAAAVVQKAKMTNALKDYKDAVASGASSQVIKAKGDALKQQQENGVAAGLVIAPSAAFNNRLEQQVALAEMRETLTAGLQNNNNNNNNNINGGGSALVIIWPHLPQGQVVILGPNAVIQGGGANSTMNMTLEESPALGGIPFVPGQPLPTMDPDNVVTSGLLLTNPESSPGTINYTVGGKQFAMERGYSQQLPAGQWHQVKFDAGGGKGLKDYWLKEEGTYEFGLDNNAWEVWKVAQKVTIDNSTNGKDFNFVYGNEQLTVRAKKGLQLESNYPLVIRFDQGKGEQPAVRLLSKGTYRVGVTPGGLDLFASTPRQNGSTGSNTQTNNAPTEISPPKRSGS